LLFLGPSYNGLYGPSSAPRIFIKIQYFIDISLSKVIFIQIWRLLPYRLLRSVHYETSIKTDGYEIFIEAVCLVKMLAKAQFDCHRGKCTH